MVEVLDHDFVRLVDHMGSDLSIVRAAVSYDAAPAGSLASPHSVAEPVGDFAESAKGRKALAHSHGYESIIAS
jgi:hypothetical protein